MSRIPSISFSFMNTGYLEYGVFTIWSMTSLNFLFPSIITISGFGVIISFAVVPPNFKTLCIISAASFSRIPSFRPMVTIVSSSLSERASSFVEPNNFNASLENFSKNHTKGARIIERTSMGLATRRDIFSEFWDAKVLGIISPNTKTRKVITPVAIPTPLEPNMFIATTVARDAAPILTRLFPMRSVMINLWGLCFIRCRTAAPFFPCLTKDLTLI